MQRQTLTHHVVSCWQIVILQKKNQGFNCFIKLKMCKNCLKKQNKEPNIHQIVLRTGESFSKFPVRMRWNKSISWSVIICIMVMTKMSFLQHSHVSGVIFQLPFKLHDWLATGGKSLHDTAGRVHENTQEKRWGKSQLFHGWMWKGDFN